MEVRQEANDRFFSEMMSKRHRQIFWQDSCQGANSYYFDTNGDVVLRPGHHRGNLLAGKAFPTAGLPVQHPNSVAGRGCDITGPLRDLRVVELAGIGPGPHAAMILGDLGADVVRIKRHAQFPTPDAWHAVAAPVVVDLKSDAGHALVLDLVGQADVLIEGYRPGVAQRLGLGPQDCAQVNDRLVYARMTGWGQDGPRSHRAGHDINYLSLTGVLNAIGHAGERPSRR